MSTEEAKPELKAEKPNQYRELITNSAARIYLMIAGGGLLVSVLTMFLIGSPIGAAILFLLGVCGLFLRWTMSPVMYVLFLGWFQFAPLGIPFESSPFSLIPGSHFQFLDLILVGSSLVYLIGQFRLYSVVHIGMPFDANKLFVKHGAKPTVRPAEPIHDWEIWMLFTRVGIAVLAGQCFWIAITYFRVDFGSVPPVVFAEPLETNSPKFDRVTREYTEPDPFFVADYMSRFLLTFTIFLIVGLSARFAFWYWELLQLRRDQARLLIVDTLWSEDRREMNRQEKWRGYRVGKMLGKAREKFGCGGWFLLLGLPAILLLLFLAIICCGGGFR